VSVGTVDTDVETDVVVDIVVDDVDNVADDEAEVGIVDVVVVIVVVVVAALALPPAAAYTAGVAVLTASLSVVMRCMLAAARDVAMLLVGRGLRYDVCA
jgi:hypothetical protein